MAWHPVLRLIVDRAAAGSAAGDPAGRTDGARLALVIEGGGMRGAITGGMAQALEDLGLGDVFDDVYGASAGALNGAWFVGRATAIGMPGWTDPELRTATIRRGNLLRGKPLVDGMYLTDVIYEQLTPMPFARVLSSPVRFHPIATDVRTGAADDLSPYVTDTPTLKCALRASTALPLMSGRPVDLGGRRWFDAGVAESVPFRTALAQGATHLLVLRSRRADEQETAEGGRSAALVARYLSRYSTELATAFLARPARLLREDAQLDEWERESAGAGGAPGPRGEGAVPAVLSIRPPAGTPSVGRLESDHSLVMAGLEAGRAEVQRRIGDAVRLA